MSAGYSKTVSFRVRGWMPHPEGPSGFRIRPKSREIEIPCDSACRPNSGPSKFLARQQFSNPGRRPLFPHPMQYHGRFMSHRNPRAPMVFRSPYVVTSTFRPTPPLRTHCRCMSLPDQRTVRTGIAGLREISRTNRRSRLATPATRRTRSNTCRSRLAAVRS